MKKWMIFCLAVVSACMMGCGGNGSSSSDEGTKTDSAALASDAASKEPAKPAFSKEAADKLLKDMEACSSPYSCDAIKSLVEFGADAIPQITTVALDQSKSKEIRKSALYALKEIKTNPGGAELFAAGKAEEDFMTRKDYFEAAAFTTDEALLNEMLAYSISKEAHKADHHTDMLSALGSADNGKVMTWIKGLGKITSDQELDVANHFSHHGGAGDVEYAVELGKGFKDLMAKCELASFRVKQGDNTGFDQLFTGMKASDKYDRSHAASCFCSDDLYEKCPADRKAEAVKLLEKVQKENATGFRSSQLKKAIEFLKK